jgi:prephenate dehydratase
MAAKALSQGKLPANTAILGSKSISRLYGLEIIAHDLQDDHQNFTSFLLVSR